MSLGLECRLPKTKLCPITEERVRNAYETIDRDVFKSWRFFRVENRGLSYMGSPTTCFWAGKGCGKAKAIKPAVEKAIKSILEATAADCRTYRWCPDPFMEEAAIMLKSLVDSVCRDMIRIDHVLRGEGAPESVKPVKLDEAKEQLGTGQLEKYIDEQAKAISFVTAAAMKANGQTVLDPVEAAPADLDQKRNGPGQAGVNSGPNMNLTIQNSNNVTLGNIQQMQNLAAGNRNSISNETPIGRKNRKSIERVVTAFVLFLAALLTVFQILFGWVGDISRFLTGK